MRATEGGPFILQPRLWLRCRIPPGNPALEVDLQRRDTCYWLLVQRHYLSQVLLLVVLLLVLVMLLVVLVLVLVVMR